MVRIMERTGDGAYRFVDGTPEFTRKQDALKHIRSNVSNPEQSSGKEFLIVGSPTTVVTETHTKVLLRTSNISRGRK